MTRGRFPGTLVLFVLMALAPVVAFGQSTITGVVHDTSGAVMPGVTVEAASPALIEKVRTAITDGQGVYRVIDLRPGVYTVTFTLPGFNTVRREGVQLPDAFVATVNADLQVGALEETVTVSGASPTVDTQSVAQRTVLTSDVLDTLPSSRFLHGYVAYLPGMSGTTLGLAAHLARDITYHGSRSGQFIIQVDGFSTAFMGSFSGISSSFFLNQAIVQETSIQTGGAAAEQEFGGVQPNVIPKEGGNAFSGYLYASYTNDKMQSDNLTDEYRAHGLTGVNKNKLIYDFNPAFGGPLRQNKLWFFGAAKMARNDRWRAGIYYDKDQTDWVYTPDLSRGFHHTNVSDYDYSLRLTYQATPRNKITIFYDQQPHWMDQRNSDGQSATAPLAAPEATNWTPYWPNAFSSITWKSPVSTRVLLEAGGAMYTTGIKTMPPHDPELIDPYHTASALEQSTNICFRASACVNGWNRPKNVSWNSRATASYVTGSHSYKLGMQSLYGWTSAATKDFEYSVRLRNGIPNQLTQRATPDERRADALEVGVFLQDQWVKGRASINYGLRFDYQRGWVPEQDLGPGPYVDARHYPRIDNLPNYKDLSPRLGVAYDLFGDGKTALKATMNRYVDLGGNGVATANNPVELSVRSATRNWTDSNGDFVPDCDLRNVLANGECGQMSDLNFGKANPRNLGYAPEILTGWGKRQYNWEQSLQIEQELVSGVSVEVGYFRRAYGNLLTTDNLLVTAADVTGYCVTAPKDDRIPGGGGNRICDLYDINPNKFGQVQNQTFQTEKFGKRIDDWRGVDATLNLRMPNGATLSGGMSTGRYHKVNCANPDQPTVLYCDTLQPFQTQIKFLGRYPLPWYGIELSGVFQNLPGQAIQAQQVFTNAEIAPSLGRNLSAGTGATVTVDLIQPDTEYFSRANQIDLRLAKHFQFGKYRVTGGLDLNNLLNGSQLQKYPAQLTANWPRPTEIQPARYIGVNATFSY